jgi:hypothetical protein
MMTDPSPHPQDIANLILYLQTELALFEQLAEKHHLDPECRAPVSRCRDMLRQSIRQLDVEEWYQQLTYGLRDQLGRLEEWF